MKEKTKERLFIGLTAARAFQGLDYARRVRSGKSIKLATAAIMTVDLLDGIVARALKADGPARRAADSATDAAIIAAGLWATHKSHPEARLYNGLLAARELFVGAGWAIDLVASRQVKKGDDWHKLPSLSVAAFGLAAHHGSDRIMKNTGRLAVGINSALAWDYFKGWTDPSRTRKLDTGVVEVAGFYDARKALFNLTNSRTQLEAGNTTPELGSGTEGEIIDLQEFRGKGELPPGSFREIK